MKTLLKWFLAVIAVGLGIFVGQQWQESLDAKRLAEEKAQWMGDKAALETALSAAQAKLAAAKDGSTRTEIVEVTKKQSPKEIIATLKTLRVTSRQTKNIRQAIQQFEALIAIGKTSLPEIKSFLKTQEDIEYDGSIFGSWKVSREGNVPIDFVFPPSLRFGLFDVVRQIGGPDAEKILADMLGVTGRGVEVAYLARVLQEMAPFQYRDLALTAAKDLLSNPMKANSSSALDKYERNYLFGVLAFYNDASLTQQAQEQLVQTDGKIDRAAMKYLQKTLAEQAVGIAANIYDDSRVKPDEKEPLARVALYYTGMNAQANQMFDKIINDSTLASDFRREMAEDLNQDGFVNEKNPTAEDLKLVEARLKLINAYDGRVTDPKIIAGFAEAKKDLLDMLPKPANPSAK